jgi:hypothetical protein
MAGRTDVPRFRATVIVVVNTSWYGTKASRIARCQGSMGIR